MLDLFRNTRLRPLFEAARLVAVDVGSRGGIEPDLEPIAWSVAAWGFEPDEAELARLQESDPGPWRSLDHLPYAIAGGKGRRELYVPTSPEGASLLRHNQAVGRDFAYDDLFRIEQVASVSTVSLDEAIAEHGIPDPSFVKLDVEGAELEILRGATRALERAVALKTEVAFIEQRVQQPLAFEVAAFLQERGYVLMDFIEPHRWRRYSTTPAPYVANDRIPYSAGQLAQGDFLFLRDPAAIEAAGGDAPEQLLRLALLSLCYGFFDHAYALFEREPLRSHVAAEFSLDALAAVEEASGAYGRRAALRAARRTLRDLIPLSRSVLRAFLR